MVAVGVWGGMVCMTPCEEVVISGLYGCVDHPSFNDAMKMKASWAWEPGCGLGNLDGSGLGGDSGYCIHRYPQFRTCTFLLY